MSLVLQLTFILNNNILKIVLVNLNYPDLQCIMGVSSECSAFLLCFNGNSDFSLLWIMRIVAHY